MKTRFITLLLCLVSLSVMGLTPVPQGQGTITRKKKTETKTEQKHTSGTKQKTEQKKPSGNSTSSRQKPQQKSKPESTSVIVNKTQTLSLNDFFPIEGISLGKTTWGEAGKLGFNVKIWENGPKRHTDFSNSAFLWDNDGDGKFESIYMTKYHSMFPLWQRLGMSWELSWNEWLQFFRGHGFNVKIVEEPTMKFYDGRNTLSGEFTATASDGSIEFKLDFNYGNDYGDGYSVTSLKTLYSIRVDSRK